MFHDRSRYVVVNVQVFVYYLYYSYSLDFLTWLLVIAGRWVAASLCILTSCSCWTVCISRFVRIHRKHFFQHIKKNIFFATLIELNSIWFTSACLVYLSYYFRLHLKALLKVCTVNRNFFFQLIHDDMYQFMRQVQEKVTCGLVGGSDLKKIAEQMGGMDGKRDYFLSYFISWYKVTHISKKQVLTRCPNEEKVLH